MWTLSPRGQRIADDNRKVWNERLKAQKRDPLSDWELDTKLFQSLPFGHPCRHEFLLRLYGHQWPEEMVIEVDGMQNYWAVRMARELCRRKRLILLGCGSSGKSFSLAAYSYTLWKTNALWSSVFMSTTSGEAGEFRAYGTIKKLHQRDRFRIGKLIDSMKTITLDEETRNDEGEKERVYMNSIKAVLIKTGSEGQNVVGTICGRKNKIVLWGCDELAFMDRGVLNARVNLFSNAHPDGFVQFVGVGNGPEEGDPLFIDGEPVGPDFPAGWRSVNKDIHEEWTTATGHCLYFNGEKSPNLMVPKGKRPAFIGVATRESIAEMTTTCGGEDTPMYWKQVIGLPPGVDVPDKIITHKLLESNRAMEQPVWLNLQRKVVAGLDLGFRRDGDPTCIDFGQIGTDESGTKILHCMGDARALISKASSQDAFEKQIATQVIDLCREKNCHDLALDVTGDGGIMLQHIEREARDQKYQLSVLPVSFSGIADDTVRTPGEKRRPTEIYANKMSQLWAQFRVLVIGRVIRGCGAQQQAVRELCGRKFGTDDKKRFVVEPKKEYKKRLRHSPDRGDSRVLLSHLALKLGLNPTPLTDSERQEQERERFDEMVAQDAYMGGHASIGGYLGH